MAAAIGVHNGTPSLLLHDQYATACALCNRENLPLKDSYCEKCQEVFKQSLEEPTVHKIVSTWQCSRCTLLNEINHVKCNACGLQKFSSVCDFMINKKYIRMLFFFLLRKKRIIKKKF